MIMVFKKSIPIQIDKFSDIIYQIFCLGASRLETKFMEDLNSMIKVKVQWPEYE